MNYGGIGMTKRDDCKRYQLIPNVGIEDNLTGNIMTTMREYCHQLNKLNKHNDTLIEESYPIILLCQRNRIRLEDLPDTMEEYIANDNDGYQGYNKCDECQHKYKRINE